MQRYDKQWHVLEPVYSQLFYIPYLVPAGSPSRNGDVAVCVLTWTNRSCPLLFILSLCLFLSLWPFQLYFIPLILLTAVFSLCSFSPISALLVLSSVYLFMKVSFSPDVIHYGWPDSTWHLWLQGYYDWLSLESCWSFQCFQYLAPVIQWWFHVSVKIAWMVWVHW